MTSLLTLGQPGTDIALSALELGTKFTRAQMLEAYGKRRTAREGSLPTHWQQIVSMQMQRLSSDAAEYHKQGRQLDLIGFLSPGRYCLREDKRPLLLEAANKSADLLHMSNRLVVASEEECKQEVINHIIGRHAQRLIMAEMQARGAKILQDTSLERAYDFTFVLPGRHATPQTMECKGTRKEESRYRLGLTANEVRAREACGLNYWIGIVHEIEIRDGKVYGGIVQITRGIEWQIVNPISYFERIPVPSQMPLFGGLI